MLKQRLLTSVIGLPVLLVAVWFNGPWFAIIAAIWGLASILEFFDIARKNKAPVLVGFGALWAVLLIVYPYFPPSFLGFFTSFPFFDAVHFIPLFITSAIIIPLAFFVLFRSKETGFTGWIWTAGGILYIGWMLSYFVSLRMLQSPTNDMSFGRNWVYLALLATFASDTFAYFVGKAWGRHRLAPDISPKKTWEGGAAGVLGSVIACLLFTLPTPFHLPLSYWQALILGIIVSIMGQIGDLAESLFKRNMSVKDSSNLIPGHGGFLDRMDSIAFAGVVVYYYVIWVVGH